MMGRQSKVQKKLFYTKFNLDRRIRKDHILRKLNKHIYFDLIYNQVRVPFGFIFDRGCFHSFSSEEDRGKFAKNVATHLGKAGPWLTIVGNADEDRQGTGPPQRTAKDIVLAVEPYFQILSLQSSYFGSNRPNPPRAWRCLMRKR